VREKDIRYLAEYVTERGKIPFREWLRALKDPVTRARIRVRLNRIRMGNFGDCKPVGEGVSELRIPFGPGYRVHSDGARILGGLSAEKIMSKPSASYRQALLHDLGDPEEAAAYLNAALEEGSQEAFLMALRDVAEAHGMSDVARRADLNRESMYRMLSRRGNPRLSSLAVLLDELGLKLTVETRETAHA